MRKSARRSRSGNPFGLIIFLLILGLVGFGLWKALPYLPQLVKPTKQFDRFNLAVSGAQTFLISVNFPNKSAVVVKFPNDLYIADVAHGYGSYKITSVYPAGELDRRGGQTLVKTLREYLGVPVDGFYYTNRPLGDFKMFLISTDFFAQRKSNLTFLDKLQLAYQLFNLRFDRIKTYNLSTIASPLVLADGSGAVSLESAEIDDFLEGLLTEKRLQEENLRVEVVNTTQTSGLGNRAMRLLTNIGLTVVNVETGANLLPGCRIKTGKDLLSTATVGRITDVYGCKIEKKEEEGRAQVTVMLGQDFADELVK